jgi:ABC-type amino acid transport system permease subunit
MRKIYQCVNFSDGCKPDAVIVSLALVFALTLALALALVPTFALGLVAIVVVIVSAACMLVIIFVVIYGLNRTGLGVLWSHGQSQYYRA